MRRWGVIFGAAALFLASPARAEITWAFMGPLTGGAASYGTMNLAGAQQAVDDINAAGGIDGQKIALKTYDDACDPKQSVAVADRIVAEGIHFVIEADCSGAAIPASKVFVEESIVSINPLASNPKLTDDASPTIFRAMYRDDAAAPVLDTIIRTRFPGRKLAIIHDKGAYGFGIATLLQNDLADDKVDAALFDSYDPANRDFSALVTKLKQEGIEVLFVGGYPVEIAAIARQMQQSGLKAQIIAGDLTDNDFWKIAGDAGEGALFVFPPDAMKSDATAKLRAELEKKKQDYNGLTFYAYAAAQVLAQALKAAPDLDKYKVASAIHHGTFDTVLGAWTFNARGDVQNIPLVLYRWHDGKFAEVKE